MTDLTITAEPTRQQIAAQGRSAPGKVTGKLKAAIEAMVWLGLKRADAAEHAGLTEHALYVAFRRPHVKAHYLTELEVLRTSERARNIHRLVEIRDAANNMPAVQAIDRLERLEDERTGSRGGQLQAPGFIIQVINQVAAVPSHMPHMREIEAKPLISHEPVRDPSVVDEG